VVKRLAVQPGQRIHREKLIDSIWPQLETPAGVVRLNKAIHFARRALGPEHIRLREEVVSLEGDPLWVDVDEFEAAAQRGDSATALALYSGDLLAESPFEPWVEARRSQLRLAASRLLGSEALIRERAGDIVGAVTLLERLIGIDPAHEAAHAGLMRLNAASGNRAAALRWYEHLVQTLRDELGVAPSDALRQLHADVAAGRDALTSARSTDE
jgi:DNA-binding SARP family transcriptional activator